MSVMRNVRGLAAAAAIGAASVSLAACGNATVPVRTVAGGGSAGAASGTTAPGGAASTPAGAPATVLPGVIAADSLTVDGRTFFVPPGVTFPPGSKIDVAVTGDGGGSVTIAAPGGPAVASFFRASLPAAGYQINADLGSLIAFSGRGWGGSVATPSDSTGTSLFTFRAMPDDTVGDTPTSTARAGSAPASNTSATKPSSATATADDSVLTPRDLNLTNVPFFIRYPAGTTVTVESDSTAGAKYVLHGHTGQEFLDFFRAELPRRHFTITGDHTNGGVTTLTFVDEGDPDEFTSVLTVSPTEVRLQHSK